MIFWIVGYVLLIIMPTISSLECQNGGVNILTRSKTAPYTFDYKCLCPYNYYGNVCTNYRGVLCYIASSTVRHYNAASGQANLQFQMFCYLQKLKKYDSKIVQSQQKNEFYRLPLNQSQISQQLDRQNYYVDNEYQIVWSNQTSMFNYLGQLIRKQNDTRSDQEILSSYPHYDFDYPQTFFGVPLFHNNITFKLKAVRFLTKSLPLSTPQISFEKEVLKDKIVGNFRVNVTQQMLQFQVGKIELTIQQYYGDQYKGFHRVSMNDGKWRVFDQKFERGQIIQGDASHMPGSIKVLLMFIFGFIFIFGAKKLVKFYKSWRNQNQMRQLGLQDQAQ